MPQAIRSQSIKSSAFTPRPATPKQSITQSALQLALELTEKTHESEIIMSLLQLDLNTVKDDRLKNSNNKLRHYLTDRPASYLQNTLNERAAAQVYGMLGMLSQHELVRLIAKAKDPDPNIINSRLIRLVDLADNDLHELKNISSNLKQLTQVSGLLNSITTGRCLEQHLATNLDEKKMALQNAESELIRKLYLDVNFLSLAAFHYVVTAEKSQIDSNLAQLMNRLSAQGKHETLLDSTYLLKTSLNEILVSMDPPTEKDIEEAPQQQQKILYTLAFELASIKNLAAEVANLFYVKSNNSPGTELTQEALQYAFSASLGLLSTTEKLETYLLQNQPDITKKTGQKVNQITENFIPVLQRYSLQPPVLDDAPPIGHIPDNQMECQHPSDEDLAHLAGIRLTSKASRTEKLEVKLQRLLNAEILPTLNRVSNDDDHLLLPECVLGALSLELKGAQNILPQMASLLKRKQLPTQKLQALRNKRDETQALIEAAQNPSLPHDLYKLYSVPQATHWRQLIQAGEIETVFKPELLQTEGQDEHCLIEMGIQPKPTSTQVKPQTVWLHVHLKKQYQHPNTSISAMITLKHLCNHANQIEAVHLKSAFFRSKGKTWAKKQSQQTQQNVLVKRSAVDVEFIRTLWKSLIHSQKAHQPPAESLPQT